LADGRSTKLLVENLTKESARTRSREEK
jgi:hypothetical protein